MSNLEVLKTDLAKQRNVDSYQFFNSSGDDVLIIPKEDLLAVMGHFKESRRFDFLCSPGHDSGWTIGLYVILWLG